jgi:hypothetical protein
MASDMQAVKEDEAGWIEAGWTLTALGRDGI